MNEAMREELWVALSILWLDAELQPLDLRNLADRLRAAGCTPEELETICRYELAPVLGANLLAPAGVWEGFDREWLIAAARRRREQWRGSAFSRGRTRLSSWLSGGVKRLGEPWRTLQRELNGPPAVDPE